MTYITWSSDFAIYLWLYLIDKHHSLGTCSVSLFFFVDHCGLYFMELNQGEIIQKPKTQELSSLFMTHRLIVMYAPVKFHEYIPYSLGVMARTPFTICN